ncbi:glyoxylate/hydroxypyruvate reductase A-like [Rhopilema esculentum]|uniref:glyoxylate/hydroxypyruvate reductase A-like n=1 Tax=Rhopilema esculentum TaxID=499914 RepID=UPI0031DA394D|eukprot:gene6302-11726_t
MTNRVKIGLLSALPNLSTRIAKRLTCLDVVDLDTCVSDRLAETGLTTSDVLEISKSERTSRIARQIEGDCSILVGDPDLIAPFLYEFKNVKWIQSTWDGVDAITKFVDHKKPYPTWKLSRFSAFGQHMAEYVLGQIIAMERNFKQSILHQMAHEWGNRQEYRLLSNLTLGLLGVGQIGSNVGRVAKTFGMNVLGMVSKEIPEAQMHPFIDEYHFSLQSLPEFLRKCDYICNSLPQTPKTDNILMNGILENCKERKSILVNIGRGNIIREKELVTALNLKWIGGAILDVFEKEPLPQDSLLWDMENVFITPHCSGLSFEYELDDFFANNLKRFMSGESPRDLINWKEGY